MSNRSPQRKITSRCILIVNHVRAVILVVGLFEGKSLILTGTYRHKYYSGVISRFCTSKDTTKLYTWTAQSTIVFIRMPHNLLIPWTWTPLVSFEGII